MHAGLDIRGKALKQSVAEQFGGALRTKVLAYAAAMNYTDGVHDVLLTSPGGVKTYLISPSKAAVARSVTR